MGKNAILAKFEANFNILKHIRLISPDNMLLNTPYIWCFFTILVPKLEANRGVFFGSMYFFEIFVGI